MRISRMCLFVDDFNPPDPVVVRRVASAAAAAGISLGCSPFCAPPLPGLEGFPPEACDAGLILGGDGTILRGFGRFMEAGIPAFGVNTGHLGYLASAEMDDVEPSLLRLASGECVVERLPAVHVTMPDGSGHSAVNDMSLNRSPRGGMLHLEVRTHDETIARMAGDGLVVSTPLGSTAYALSAGGPVLDPGIPALLMVALCPHQLSLRPIVFSAGTTLEIGVRQTRGEDPVVCIAGRPAGGLGQGERAVVRYREGCCPVIRLSPGDGFYARLSRKFGWGARG